jgi:O-antigen/teichoic acid export membrane protein
MSGQPSTAPDRIRTNVGFSLLVRLTGGVFTTVLTLFLVRALDPDGYGTFALALSIGTLVLIPANLGVSQAAARFVAEHRGDHVSAGKVVSDAFRLKLGASMFFTGALVALAGPIASAYGAPELEVPLRIMALAMFGQTLLQLYDSVFEAIGRLGVYLRVVLLESATETVASIAIVLLGGGAAGAMWGRTIAYTVAALLGGILLARTFGRVAIPTSLDRGYGNVGRIAKYGSALLLVEGAFALFSRIDVLLIGGILSVTAVGLFEAPLRLTTIFAYVGSSVGSGVAPRLARGREAPSREAFEQSLRWMCVFQGVALAPLVVWADPLTELTLGPGYEDSADVLRALAPYVFLTGISPLLAGAVNYLGEARRRVPIAVGALSLNAAIDLVLLSKIGIVGGAIGTDVGYGVYVAAHFLIIRRLLGTPLRPLARTLLRTGAAAVAMGAALLAFGTDVGWPILIVGGALGTGVYLAALLLTREISLEQARAGWTLVRAVPARLRGRQAQG